MWLTSARNIRELARNDGFNEYFQKQFNGNEATFLKWKEAFDVLEMLGGEEIIVPDFDDAMGYVKRAKEGFEEQLGRDSEKALEATLGLIAMMGSSQAELIRSQVELIGKLGDLVKMSVRALGEENFVTLDTLDVLGNALQRNEQFEEAKEVWEINFLAVRTKALGEAHKDTCQTLNNLGVVFKKLKNYEKALEYYERALKGSETVAGKTHPETLDIVTNIAGVYHVLKDEKAEELYPRALEGYEE
ncbi:hypothetical protein TL16_g00691 [Triparma laevis f. inornata]|uniref:Kinesin light chain n=1 Tax=Triparma laevis f. inornata TaxID=1714386 RepID=A0A9W6ZCZ7_9STRA|nr:hypothetical protein TL16_g00691 [Triparma laevis f. inornata]